MNNAYEYFLAVDHTRCCVGALKHILDGCHQHLSILGFSLKVSLKQYTKANKQQTSYQWSILDLRETSRAKKSTKSHLGPWIHKLRIVLKTKTTVHTLLIHPHHRPEQAHRRLQSWEPGRSAHIRPRPRSTPPASASYRQSPGERWGTGRWPW